MLEKYLFLDLKNLKSYLEKTVFPNLPFKIVKIIKLEEVGYGNNNYLFKIIFKTLKGKKILFLKQARPYNKRAASRGEKIFVHPQRIFGEVKALKILREIWGSNLTPQILFFDKINFCFLMTDVSTDGRLLVEEFKKDRVHPKLGGFFGRFFGRLHGRTHNNKIEYSGDLAWKKYLLKRLYLHWGMGLKKFFSAAKVEKIFKDSQKEKFSAIWADPVFRNIFIKKGKASFVDFDFFMSFDPAFDLGIFLAHWAWMMENESKKVGFDSKIFIKNFIKSYKIEFLKNQKNTQKDLAEILERSLDWLALYLVSRTDGKSGSYFKDYQKWEQKIRQLGLDLFAKNYKNLAALTIKNLIIV